MYVYCVYSAMSKKKKPTAKLSERSFSSFSNVFSVKSTLILLPFLTVALHESGTRKALLSP